MTNGPRKIRRWSGAVVLAVVAGGLVVPFTVTAPANASIAENNSCASGSQYPSFDRESDGYSHYADCVISVPDRTVAGQAHAGAVEVQQTNAGHVVLTRTSVEYGLGFELGDGKSWHDDRFGAALVAQDLDGDGYSDLVIGAPGDSGGGIVYLVYGSPDGLGKGRDSQFLAASVYGNDEFGAALSSYPEQVGEYMHVRVLVGAPGTTVNGARDAGAVYQYTFSYRLPQYGAPMASIGGGGRLTEASRAPLGQPNAGERFGAALQSTACGDFIGAPGEVVDGHKGAGAVVYAMKSSIVRWTQNTANVVGTAGSGDGFGSSINVTWSPAPVAIGAPGETVAGKKGAGSVTVIAPKTCAAPAKTLTSRLLTEGIVKGSGAPASRDHFGTSVIWTSYGAKAQLAVGVPGHDIGSRTDAGAIVWFGLSRTACTPTTNLCGRIHTQSSGWTGSVNTGNRFGTTLGVQWFDDLAPRLMVGAPGSLAGRGRIAVSIAKYTYDTSWFHPQPGDRAGTVAALV